MAYSRERLGCIQGGKGGIGARDLPEVNGFRQEVMTNGIYTYMAFTGETYTDVGFFLDQQDGIREGTLIVVYEPTITRIFKIDAVGTGATEVSFIATV